MDTRGARPRPAADGDGFTQFVEAESSRLVAAATVILGDRQRAEELAQDTLVKAFGRWKRLRRLDRPGAWTRRVVINAAISEQRRRGSERRALRRVAGRPAPAPPDLSPDDELWAAVRRLPSDQAQALALRYGADLDAADVGEALGLSPSATNALLYRARRRLRDDLAGQHRTGTEATEVPTVPTPVPGTTTTITSPTTRHPATDEAHHE